MPTVSFSGLATGLDSQAIVRSLVDVQRIPVQRLEQDNAFNRSKISVIDGLSSALADLRTAATDIDTRGEFLSYAGTVSDESVAKLTTSGDAVPGQYTMEVISLASAQRTYSDTIADKTASLSASDQTLSFTVGSTTTDVTITAGSSLEQVVGEINASGAPVSAGILFDGTNYRLQVVGQSTGSDNAITFSDTGLGLGLDTPANTVQAATDASFTLDGFAVTSSTNIVNDVLPGVTLELDQVTTAPVELAITPDSDALEEKLQGFVDSYNAVFGIINAQVGEGRGRGTLNGDSTVRNIELGLSRLISSPIPGLTDANGDTMQLSNLGIQTQNDGTLTLDSTKLAETLAGGFTEAARYFAGDTSAGIDGMGQLLDDLIDSYTDSVDGLLSARKDGITAQIEDNDSRIESLERYISTFEQNLLDQFSALEGSISALQSQQNFLAQFVNSL